MIELINVSKYYPTEFGRHYVFKNVSLKLPLDKNVGVLGPNGAGKSTFLRLLGGADAPSEGRIIKSGSISPPMGLTPSLQPSLTASENMRFAGRIYGLDRDEINETIEFVRNLTGIGKYFDLPVATYSSGMRSRVAFAINISLSFDFYLFDELSAGGDKEFRKITAQMVQQRLKTSKFIVASHRVEELLELCDTGIIIQNGELTYFDSIRDAVTAYGDIEALESAKTQAIRSALGDAQESPEDAGEAAAPRTPTRQESAEKKRRYREAVKAARLARQQEALAADGQTGNEETPAPSPESAPAPKRKRRSRKVPPAAPDNPAIAAPAPAEIPVPVASVSPEPVTSDDARAIARAARLERRRAKQRQALEKTDAAEPAAADSGIHPVLLVASATAIAVETSPRNKARHHKKPGAGAGATNQTPEAVAEVAAAVLPVAGKRWQRALNHQAMAEARSAEALAMLLDLLDRQPGTGIAGDPHGLASRVVAAQHQAAHAAARARASLEIYSAAVGGGFSMEHVPETGAVPAHHDLLSRFRAPAERPDLTL